MTLRSWLDLMWEEVRAARASGRPDLWHTDFKTVSLVKVLNEIEQACSLEWTEGDTPPPRPGNNEIARSCFVTCERKGLRFVAKAQYNFAQKGWFFDDPPSGTIKVVAWMDAPAPFQPSLAPAGVALSA